MKEFNVEKFCKDLVMLRGGETQSSFANKMNINRSTLSLIENGKQMPTFDILSRVCELLGKNTDEYFAESRKDSLVFLMGTLDENDKEKVLEMADRISIKEKYELLGKRGTYVIHK